MRNKSWESCTLLSVTHAPAPSVSATPTFALAALAAAAALSFAAFSIVAVSHLHTASPVHTVPAHVHAVAVLQETVDGVRHEILAIDIILDGIVDTETIGCLSRDHSDQHGQEEENETGLHGNYLLFTRICSNCEIVSYSLFRKNGTICTTSRMDPHDQDNKKNCDATLASIFFIELFLYIFPRGI